MTLWEFTIGAVHVIAILLINQRFVKLKWQLFIDFTSWPGINSSLLCPNSIKIILWYPGCVHGYLYPISLVLSNQVFPGAQPKRVVLYLIFSTLHLHIPCMLHNSVDHQLNCPLPFHCVELWPAGSYPFFQVHSPVGMICQDWKHHKSTLLRTTFNRLISHYIFVCVYTCTLYSFSYFVLPCIITKSCAKHYYYYRGIRGTTLKHI